jgi:hypothetical protein
MKQIFWGPIYFVLFELKLQGLKIILNSPSSLLLTQNRIELVFKCNKTRKTKDKGKPS